MLNSNRAKTHHCGSPFIWLLHRLFLSFHCSKKWRLLRRPRITWHRSKGPATRNDFVNDIVNDRGLDAIFATLKNIVNDETSTISSTISLRVAWPLVASHVRCPSAFLSLIGVELYHMQLTGLQMLHLRRCQHQ